MSSCPKCEEEKSIEYMIQYMQDYTNVSHDCVMNYLWKTRDKGVKRE